VHICRRFLFLPVQIAMNLNILTFRPLVIVLGLLAVAARPSPAQEEKDNVPPPGFTALFNGRDLSGWKVPAGDNGHWKVENGVIDYDARSEAKGGKDLWTEREFGDFVLRVDWRIKETPYQNPNVPYILPDGSEARDITGKPFKMTLPDSDSGILLRGNATYQINIWCWPIGSGEMYGVRRNAKLPAEVRAGVTPRTQADHPVGQWNRYEITARGHDISVKLNGKAVLPGVTIPGIPSSGPIGLQHHGSMRDGKWTSPPALVQFKNIYIQELTR
jgi:hypothetical protein